MAGCIPYWGPPSQWKTGRFSRSRATRPQLRAAASTCRTPGRASPSTAHTPACSSSTTLRLVPSQQKEEEAEASLSPPGPPSTSRLPASFAGISRSTASAVASASSLRRTRTTAAAPASASGFASVAAIPKVKQLKQKSIPRPPPPSTATTGACSSTPPTSKVPATRSRIGAFRAESTRFTPGRITTVQISAPAAWSSSPWRPARTWCLDGPRA